MIIVLLRFMFAGKGSKQALANNDEISLVLPKNKGFFFFDTNCLYLLFAGLLRKLWRKLQEILGHRDKKQWISFCFFWWVSWVQKFSSYLHM